MDTIEELAADERTARVILAVASEPADEVTGRMVRAWGAAGAVARAAGAVARAAGAEVPAGPDGDTWQRRLGPRLDPGQIARVLADTERHGLRVLIPGDADWPAAVDVLGDRAPLVLWAKGDTNLLASSVRDRLTLTGARAATGYGEHVAAELAQSAVADGRQVVAGGAYGIEGAAHRATLAAGGRPVAVMPGGLDRLYPAGHAELLTRVGETGVLLSEMAPGSAPTKWRSVDRTTATGAGWCVTGSCACVCSVVHIRSLIRRSGSWRMRRDQPSLRLKRSCWTSGLRGTRSRVVGRTRSVCCGGIAIWI